MSGMVASTYDSMMQELSSKDADPKMLQFDAQLFGTALQENGAGNIADSTHDGTCSGAAGTTGLQNAG